MPFDCSLGFNYETWPGDPLNLPLQADIVNLLVPNQRVYFNELPSISVHHCANHQAIEMRLQICI